MPEPMSPRFLDAGDAAFTVEFGDAISPDLLAAVQSLDAAIAAGCAAGRLPGLVETMPTFRSLTVFFDPLVTGRDRLIESLRPLLAPAAAGGGVAAGRRWRLPARYDADCGPDLAAVADAIGTTVDEVVALHAGTGYRVYMLGFLPGFPFMGDVADPLRLPRRSEPRVRVPPGSVAVAVGLTAIYPWESPGGWHLLARCPVPLFDARREASPSLLAAGDSVRFEPVSAAEYARIDAACRRGDADPSRWHDAAEAAP